MHLLTGQARNGFFDDMQSVLDSIIADYLLLIVGDFNAIGWDVLREVTHGMVWVAVMELVVLTTMGKPCCPGVLRIVWQ